MFKSILLPIDLNDRHSFDRPLPVAVDMARSWKAELHLMTVVPEFGMSIVAASFPRDYERQALEAAKAALEKLAGEKVPADLGCKVHIGHGTIYKEVLRVAESLGCDLIVMGSHRPELADYLLGPNAARVVRHARRSVMVVR